MKGRTTRGRKASAWMQRAVLLIVVATGAMAASASAAIAETVWNLDVHHNETNFPPGGTAEFWFDINNVGDTATEGPITLTVELPDGITRDSILDFSLNEIPLPWSCPGGSGDSTVVCTTSGSIPRHRMSRRLQLSVNVDPAASGEKTATVTLEGGGADEAITVEETVMIDASPARFGIVDDSFVADFYEADGLTPDRRSGSHPERATFSFDFNSVSAPISIQPNQKSPTEAPRHLTVELPDGFAGDTTAVGACTAAELYLQSCPSSSQVGRLDATLYPPFVTGNNNVYNLSTGIYNMTAKKGVISDLGFVLSGNPIHIQVSLNAANNYTVQSSINDLNESIPPFTNKVTIWGIPGDESHDSERCSGSGGAGFSPFGNTTNECPSGIPAKPYLTAPFQCDEDFRMRLGDYDSWQNTGVFGPDVFYDMPGRFTGCDKPKFEPKVSVKPTVRRADSPTGLDVEIDLPQNSNPNGIATSPLRKAVVELPQGMAVNPSAADGLGACSEAQIGLRTDDPVGCPNSSKLGTAVLDTPVLADPIPGTVYLAEQGNKGPGQGSNPFDSLLAMYLVLEDKDLGLLVKLPGEVVADPDTGQLRTVFDENPQLPFSKLSLSLRDGNRAPLLNPPTCGTYEAAGEFSPWARPEEVVSATSSFTIDRGPDGGSCSSGDPAQPGDPADLADRPFDPEMKAGVIDPIAGAFSPFVMQLTREDGDQEFLSTTVSPPKGVTAKLAGIPLCSEPDVAAGSCGPESQVGETIVGAGGGTNPFYIQAPDEGHVYMAGPYKGAPLSLLIQQPSKAGPFDLGMVDVRAAIHVDPRTAQLSVVSDEIPQILDGIPLHVRDIRVRMNRPDFTIAPTNCDPMQVNAEVHGSHGATASLSNHFQVNGCGNLGFGPDLNLSFGKSKKNTKPNSHPPLKATVGFNEGDSNISSVEVALPQGLFLDQERLGRICSRANYAAETCPEESRVGYAKATTPLLDDPVEGPVYLKASDNPLPDLAADLNGQIDVDLFGKIDQKQNRKGLNQIRNTFDIVPDVPVSDFELTLDGGSDGLLVNSRNICRSKKAQKVSIDMVAHNEMTLSERPLVESACQKLAKKNKKKAKKLKAKAKKLLKKAKKTDNKRKAKKLRKQARKLKKQARKLGR